MLLALLTSDNTKRALLELPMVTLDGMVIVLLNVVFPAEPNKRSELAASSEVSSKVPSLLKSM